jgi:hypothetical protein
MKDEITGKWSREFGEYEYIKDLSRNPVNQEIYDAYREWLKKTIEETKVKKEFHWPTLMDQQQKLAFLEAQDADDYEKMQRIASECNPNWLAIVSRPTIVNCGRDDPEYDKEMETWWKMSKNFHREETLAEWLANHPSFRMDFVCSKKWHEMQATHDRKVRFCGDCEQNVYLCDNIVEARELGDQGCCIGIDIGIKRTPDDLVGELSIFGRPTPEHIEENKQRLVPDRISAKRIMKKVELNMVGKYPPAPAETVSDYRD